MYSQNINRQKKILGWSTCMSQTFEGSNKADHGLSMSLEGKSHSYDILGAGMLWKPKEARIL